VAVALYLAFLIWKLCTQVALPETQRIAIVIAAILIAQLCLGVSNIVFNFPLAVAVAHNLVGALLLLALVTLNHRVFTAQPL
jgi:cytochrome c oxidase assembly protein subunit 15